MAKYISTIFVFLRFITVLYNALNKLFGHVSMEDILAMVYWMNPAPPPPNPLAWGWPRYAPIHSYRVYGVQCKLLTNICPTDIAILKICSFLRHYRDFETKWRNIASSIDKLR